MNETELTKAMTQIWRMIMEEQRNVVSYLSRPLTAEEMEQQRRFWRGKDAHDNSSL